VVARDADAFEAYLRVFVARLFALAKEQNGKVKYATVAEFLELEPGMGCKITEFCFAVTNLVFFVQASAKRGRGVKS